MRRKKEKKGLSAQIRSLRTVRELEMPATPAAAACRRACRAAAIVESCCSCKVFEVERSLDRVSKTGLEDKLYDTELQP
jgi:hypothetical protein